MLRVFIAGHPTRGFALALPRAHWEDGCLDQLPQTFLFVSLFFLSYLFVFETFHLDDASDASDFVRILTFQDASFSLRPGQVKSGLSGVVRSIIMPETKLIMRRKVVGSLILSKLKRESSLAFYPTVKENKTHKHIHVNRTAHKNCKSTNHHQPQQPDWQEGRRALPSG